jgi:hypothetical protein
MCQFTNVPMYQCANLPMCRCGDVAMWRCANLLMYQSLVWKLWGKDFLDGLQLHGFMSKFRNPVVEVVATIRFRNGGISADILKIQTKTARLSVTNRNSQRPVGPKYVSPRCQPWVGGRARKYRRRRMPSVKLNCLFHNSQSVVSNRWFRQAQPPIGAWHFGEDWLNRRLGCCSF